MGRPVGVVPGGRWRLQGEQLGQGSQLTDEGCPLGSGLLRARRRLVGEANGHPRGYGAHPDQLRLDGRHWDAPLTAEQDGPLLRPSLDNGRLGASGERHRSNLHRPDAKTAQRGERPLVPGQLCPNHYRRREMQTAQGA